LKEVLLSFAAGMIIAIIFKLLKLPLPAPPVLAGVMGIVGVYFGGIAYEWLTAWLKAGKP
jgi:XapX domain-containing protein